jgi:1,2-diacylglycerol 3-alpha-glucosyltransferase
MRIGIFTDHFYPELGGIQDSIAELVRELSKRGHTVHIWAPRASKKNFELSHLPEGEAQWEERVHIHRVPSFPLPSSSLQSRFASPFFRVEEELDILHTHSFFGVGYRALTVARQKKIPLVGTNHWAITEFSDYMHWLFEHVFKTVSIRYVTWYYNHCAFVTAPSKTVLLEKEVAGLRAPYAVVSNPIDTGVFHPATLDERKAARRKWELEGKVIACVGRIAPEKKNDIVIRAFARLLARVPDAVLTLGGHGSFEGEMKELTKRLGVEKHVRFLGTLTKREVSELFHAADAYAIASVSESQSMTLIQAFAAGLPAVGARWRAIPEYLNEERGFLFVRNDWEAMAGHLETLLLNDPLRKNMGERAHQFAQKFSTSAIVDEWEKIYKKVVEGHVEKLLRAKLI